MSEEFQITDVPSGCDLQLNGSIKVMKIIEYREETISMKIYFSFS
jgi:hypothetical protein